MPTPKVALKTVPVLKTILYAGLAAELVKNSGMTDPDQIAAIQKCVADGMVSAVIVRGVHPDGREETFTLALKPFGHSDTVELTPEPGKSFFEMLDTGLAGGIQYAADQIRRMGLKPRFEVDWSAKAKANPSQVAAAARTLNIKGPPPPPPPPPPSDPWPPMLLTTPPIYVPPAAPPVRYPQTVRTYTPPPPPPPGFVRQTVLEITPAKDPGVTFTITSIRKAT